MELTKPPGLSDVGPGVAVVIVTGAGSGIGAATALLLGSAGAHVVLVGRRPDPLEEVAAEVRSRAHALCVPADLADPASPQRIAGAAARYGRIDGLVKNAAVVRHKALAEWDTAASTSTWPRTSAPRSS